jgi:hypothetical protein
MDSPEIFLSMYVRNLREEKYVENILNATRTKLHRTGDGKEEVRCLVLGRN